MTLDRLGLAESPESPESLVKLFVAVSSEPRHLVATLPVQPETGQRRFSDDSANLPAREPHKHLFLVLRRVTSTDYHGIGNQLGYRLVLVIGINPDCPLIVTLNDFSHLGGTLFEVLAFLLVYLCR